MKIAKITLALLVIILATISLLNPALDLTIIYLLLAGVLLLILGIEELRKERKALGYPLIIIGVFNFVVLFISFFIS